MLPLAHKQPVRQIEPRQRFWIDPEVEVALTAQINEHFPKESASVDILARDYAIASSPALMDCYNQDNPDCMLGLPSSLQNGNGAA